MYNDVTFKFQYEIKPDSVSTLGIHRKPKISTYKL